MWSSLAEFSVAASLSDAKGVFAEWDSRIHSFIHSLSHQAFTECLLCALSCARCQGYLGEQTLLLEHAQSNGAGRQAGRPP